MDAWRLKWNLGGSVADPDPNPDPPDPQVFGPPGSRSTSQGYGSGSGSFYHHAKNDVKVEKIVYKNYFFAGILKVNDENSGSGYESRIRIHLSEAWIRGPGSGSTPKCHGSATLLGGFVGLWSQQASSFPSLWWGTGSGSALKWRVGSGFRIRNLALKQHRSGRNFLCFCSFL